MLGWVFKHKIYIARDSIMIIMVDEKVYSKETGSYKGKDANVGEIIKEFDSGKLHVTLKRVK